MAKKYSVQMEGEEIVSVEVDGVAYTDPEDIPDKHDRKKIKNLIAAQADAEDGSVDDADLGLDREFAAEIQEMEKQSAIFPKLLAGIFGAIAAISLAVAGFSAYSAAQTVSREVPAPGEVIELVDRLSRDSETGVVTIYSYPVVAFTPSGQAQRTVQMSEGSSPPEYEPGDQVTVLYDPAQPRSARIKSFSSDLLLWLLPGITLVVGAAFGAVTFVVIKVFPQNSAKAFANIMK